MFEYFLSQVYISFVEKILLVLVVGDTSTVGVPDYI